MIVSNTNKIPKIIHYCWFGKGDIPKLTLKCIESWKKYCPDYKIMKWDESNFDVNRILYTKQAYEKKKYAFVTDYVRLYALYNYGGVYMDTDVEVIKNIDSFLNCGVFSGFENDDHIQTGIMGSTKDHKLISTLMNMYDDQQFIKDGQMDLTTNVTRITNYMVAHYRIVLNNSLQVLDNDIYIYPKDYFCPKDISTDKISITKNTYSIHHFAGSWIPRMTKIGNSIKLIIQRLVGKNRYNAMKRILKIFV